MPFGSSESRGKATMTNLVFMAGIGNSEPAHWQALWAESNPGSVWVEPASWDAPVRDEWVHALKRDLRRVAAPKVIVAHSLGCLVVAEAAEDLIGAGVVGAFLVSVPDTEGPRFPTLALGFKHASALRLPVKSLVVASSDDPYGSYAHSARAARLWGSELVPIGAKGHVNLASDLGHWPDGQALLARFTASL
jgi:predicted alpha/beta hydrolase family esterase